MLKRTANCNSTICSELNSFQLLLDYVFIYHDVVLHMLYNKVWLTILCWAASSVDKSPEERAAQGSLVGLVAPKCTEFVVGSFGLDVILLTDDRILDPCHETFE